MTKTVHESGRDRLHRWWGLSYANYLTLPRSLMQSMPDEWQGQMATMLEQIAMAASQHGIEWPPEDHHIDVRLTHRPEGGRKIVVTDELSNYERGRRRLW